MDLAWLRLAKEPWMVVLSWVYPHYLNETDSFLHPAAQLDISGTT